MEEGARSRIEIETGSTRATRSATGGLFEHVNLAGRELWVGEGVVADVFVFGWNDTISSMSCRE
jgi:hypothetical protein